MLCMSKQDTAAIHPVFALQRLYGWSASRLADYSGVSRETLRLVSAGQKRFSRAHLIRLAATMDVPLQLLTERTDDQAVKWVLANREWQHKPLRDATVKHREEVLPYDPRNGHLPASCSRTVNPIRLLAA